MEELQKHPGTFLYMRTYSQSGTETLVPALLQAQRPADDTANLPPLTDNQQLAVYSSKEKCLSFRRHLRSS